ncbi:uncharacterized protein LOC120449618 [Drosophila santomea]|uniref:uncharacterized protein LOC120449618 n=1 Tax=Drosophila santomea TaxID=129105 RepID=UPI0019533034|nr:uncharacterized protein LOC120449618 [Drosophila santomea]XP_039488136.1 uncharacterized protein LOC120449618 [Drosophila santomea]
MEAQGENESSGQTSKPNDRNETVAKCCFMISVGSDGLIEISSLNHESKSPQSETHSGNSPLTNDSSAAKKQCIALLKGDSNVVDDDSAESLEKSKNAKSIEEIQKTETLPPFVRICNKDLANRPSFVVLEDALARNRIKQDMEQSKEDLSVECQAQQTSVSNSGSQTDKAFPQYPTTKNSTQKGNTVPPARKSSLQTAAQVRQKLSNLRREQAQPQGHPPLNEQQQHHMSYLQHQNMHQHVLQQQHLPQQQHQHVQQHLALHQPSNLRVQPTNNPPYVTISFLPMDQTGAASSGLAMYPGQQFLCATPSSMSSCSCCTCSSCCPSRTTQVCQMQMGNQYQSPANGSNCCMLRPESFAKGCYNGGTSCCPLSNVESHPSMGFGGQISQHLMHPVFGTTCPLQQQQPNIPISGGFYPCCSCQSLCNQCSQCRVHAHPCCHCLGFFNNQQMFQSQQQQQVQSACCPLKPNQRRNYPSKEKAQRCSEGSHNQAAIKHIFSKKHQAQEQPQDTQDGQDSEVTSKISPLPRSVGGTASVRTNPSPSSLYVARFGRTCLILRPTSNALMPRLLTRRISRYTSVIAWPAKSVKPRIDTS